MARPFSTTLSLVLVCALSACLNRTAPEATFDQVGAEIEAPSDAAPQNEVAQSAPVTEGTESSKADRQTVATGSTTIAPISPPTTTAPSVAPSPDPIPEIVSVADLAAGDEMDLDGELAFEDISSGEAQVAQREFAGKVAAGATAKRSVRDRSKSMKRKEEAARRGPMPSADAVAVGGQIAPAPPPAKPVSVPVPTPAPPPVASNTEHYTNYGINGFDLVERDALSTFAIDVDTASYTLTRRKLREGYLPPTSAVRVEEFVNYFPYEYTRPEPGNPFTVDFEASRSPWNPQNHVVRVGVQGKKVSMDQRKSVHLTFLVDVSGSMQSSDKLGLLKETLKMLTEELEDGDTVAIATYAGNTKVVLEPTPMSQKRDIIRALDRLTAGGSTAMGAGIDLAYGLADKSHVQGTVNRVIVCSDGDANVGRTSHQDLSAKIRGYAQNGITLTTLGFGNGNYKDTMMERLANDGDGNYFYVDSIQESRRIFVDKLSSTMEVIAKDVKIQVEFDPEKVIAYRLIGYENRDIADKDFRNDKVDAGEIGSGHQVTALYEVALKDNVTGNLGTVRVRNKAPGPDSPAVERSFAWTDSSLRPRFAETSNEFRIALAAASFAEILRGSPHLQEVSLSEVASIARSAQRPEYTEDQELVELIERAAQLKGERSYSAR